MINAFSPTDEPRVVQSVSVDTPIVSAVSLQNDGDMGRYNLKLIAGFLMANAVQQKQFVAYQPGDNVEAPIDIADPCGLTSYKTSNTLIGLSTLFADTQSDVYTGRLSSDVRHLLEDVDKNSFYVDQSLFQINELLKTQPFTSNYLLREAQGAQDVIFLPFLPKFRIANGRSVDSYETRVCMIVEVEPYTGGVFSDKVTNRRLLVVESRSPAASTNAIDNQFTMTTADYRVAPANLSVTARSTSSGTTVNVTIHHKAKGDVFTSENERLSHAIIGLGSVCALFTLIIVGVHSYNKLVKEN